MSNQTFVWLALLAFLYPGLYIFAEVGPSQGTSHSLHDPHGDPDMQTNPPLILREVVLRDRLGVLLEPSLLVAKLLFQGLIAGDDESAHLEIERIATLRVIGAADDGHGWMLVAGERDPEALGVVAPTLGLPHGAAPPFLESDLVIAAIRVDGAEKATC